MMKKVHLICNAHIDPIWQWDWQEGVSAVISTFRSAVNLAKDFDYIFCHNEVTVIRKKQPRWSYRSGRQTRNWCLENTK